MNYQHLDDDGKLLRRWRNKRDYANHIGIGCNLTFEQYCSLVQEAGLTSSMLGFNGQHYDLARYNDTGPYTYGNCRFITHTENVREQKRSELQRQTAIQNIQKAQVVGNMYSQQIKQRIHEAHNGGSWFSVEELFNPHIWLHVQKIFRDNHYRLYEANRSYVGQNNSQYGTHWITNGVQNAKIQHGIPLPEGWRFGRVNCN